MFNNIQNTLIIHRLFHNFDQICLISNPHHNNIKQWLTVNKHPTKVEKIEFRTPIQAKQPIPQVTDA